MDAHSQIPTQQTPCMRWFIGNIHITLSMLLKNGFASLKSRVQYVFTCSRIQRGFFNRSIIRVCVSEQMYAVVLATGDSARKIGFATQVTRRIFQIGGG